MNKYKTRHFSFVLAIFGVALAANAAFAGTSPTVPAVPEPSGALLFAAGVVVAAISIRIFRRK
jgi:hypothetical protein